MRVKPGQVWIADKVILKIEEVQEDVMYYRWLQYPSSNRGRQEVSGNWTYENLISIGYTLSEVDQVKDIIERYELG